MSVSNLCVAVTDDNKRVTRSKVIPKTAAWANGSLAPPACGASSLATKSSHGTVTLIQPPKKNTVSKQKLVRETTKHDNTVPVLAIEKLALVNMVRGGDSFAPANFKFMPPSNLSSFVRNPLSPSSSAAFLKPSSDPDIKWPTPPSQDSTSDRRFLNHFEICIDFTKKIRLKSIWTL